MPDVVSCCQGGSGGGVRTGQEVSVFIPPPFIPPSLPENVIYDPLKRYQILGCGKLGWGGRGGGWVRSNVATFLSGKRHSSTLQLLRKIMKIRAIENLTLGHLKKPTLIQDSCQFKKRFLWLLDNIGIYFGFPVWVNDNYYDKRLILWKITISQDFKRNVSVALDLLTAYWPFWFPILIFRQTFCVWEQGKGLVACAQRLDLF